MTGLGRFGLDSCRPAEGRGTGVGGCSGAAVAMRVMHKQTERETQQRAALSERQAKADRNRSEGEAIKNTSLISYAQKCHF